MRAKVYYGLEIHMINLDNVLNLQDLKWTVKKSFTNILPKQINFMTEHADTLDDNILNDMRRRKQSVINLFIVSNQDSILKSVKSQQSFEYLQNDSAIQQPKLKMNQKPITNADKEYKIVEQQDYKYNDDEELELLLCKDKEQLRSNQAPSHIKDKQVINEDIQCNGCLAFPIKGPILKCLVCHDFDLCASCQQTQHHHHPFVKITRKNQYPIHTEVKFTRESKNEMIRLQMQEKSLKDQKMEANKKTQQRINNCQVIPLSQLKVTKVCAKNFLSEILGSSY